MYKSSNVGTQKINGSQLEIFGIIVSSFLIDDKDEKSPVFETTFLLVDISIDITFEMPFLNLNNIWINFNNWELR